MHLNYLEIGTSDFRTEVEKSDAVGMSVEPIKYYLDRLPNKENNTKVNCAISTDDQEGQIEIYYVPLDIIKAEKLPNWLRGCNSVNGYHPKHKELKVEKFVKKELVPLMSIKSLIEKYNIVSIDYLKIDTEGQDCKILKCLFKYVENRTLLQPNKITFETNVLSTERDVKEIIQLYKKIGYKVISTGNDTTIAK